MSEIAGHELRILFLYMKTVHCPYIKKKFEYQLVLGTAEG